jgi:hypothetical protein
LREGAVPEDLSQYEAVRVSLDALRVEVAALRQDIAALRRDWDEVNYLRGLRETAKETEKGLR